MTCSKHHFTDFSAKTRRFSILQTRRGHFRRLARGHRVDVDSRSDAAAMPEVQCTICCEDFVEGERLRLLPCLHRRTMVLVGLEAQF